MRYFLPHKGIQIKILVVKDLPGESSEILKTYIDDLLTKYSLKKKLLALCADNTNCNFGGAARRGKNNLFHKLEESAGNTLIGVNCAAHIINNCIQTALECLPIDIEVIVVKIFSYFYIYTVRVQNLKEMCDAVDVEYKKLLGFSKTRWLTLKPSIERILKLFKPLKKYFLEQPKCPTIIYKFFEDPTAEAWLLFVHYQACLFHNYIGQIESQQISMTEVALLIKELKSKIIERRNETFIPLAVRNLISQLDEKNLDYLNEFRNCAKIFYKSCIDYLSEYDKAYKEVEILEWVLLRSIPPWTSVEQNLLFLTEKRKDININDGELFDEFSCVKNYVTSDKLKEWDCDGKLVVDKWIELFNHFKANSIPFKNILKIVEFALSLPGSNAPTERIFSILNNIWTDEKSQMKVETIKAILTVKCNFDLTCMEFQEYLKNENELLNKIQSSQKYQ